MVFGIHEALKQDMSEISARDVLSAARRAIAIRTMEDMGLTEYDISLIQHAEAVDYLGASIKYRIQDLRYDSRGETETAKRLFAEDLAEVRNDRYWLTKQGEKLHHDLLALSSDRKLPKHVMASPAANLPVKVENVEEQMDINLGRDGLMETCSKLVWIMSNRDTIEQFKAQQFVEQFKNSQNEINKIVAAINAPRAPIVLPPVEEDSPLWTEEMQRAQNDLYWMSDGKAFWLNPNGVLADPVPAPEWWSPPKNYQPFEYEPKLSVAERSLLALPIEAVATDLPPGLVKATPEEIARKHREKYAEEHYFDEEVTPKQVALSREYQYFGKLLHADQVFAFRNDREIGNWQEASADTPYTFVARGSQGYGSMLMEYEKQQSKATVLDEIISELDRLNSDPVDEYYDHSDWLEEIQIRTGELQRIGSNTVVPMVMTSANHDLYIINHNDKVRGFPSKVEANKFLARVQKADKLKAEQAAKQLHKQYQTEKKRQTQEELLAAAKRNLAAIRATRK